MKSKPVLKVEQLIELWQYWEAFVELINGSELLFMSVTHRELGSSWVILKHIPSSAQDPDTKGSTRWMDLWHSLEDSRSIKNTDWITKRPLKCLLEFASNEWMTVWFSDWKTSFYGCCRLTSPHFCCVLNNCFYCTQARRQKKKKIYKGSRVL